MIDKDYLELQAVTLLKLAKITPSRRKAALFAAKAVEMQAQAENPVTPVPSEVPEPPR